MRKRSFLWLLVPVAALVFMVGGCGGGGGGNSSNPTPPDSSNENMVDEPILSDEEQIELFINGYIPVSFDELVFPDGSFVNDYISENSMVPNDVTEAFSVRGTEKVTRNQLISRMLSAATFYLDTNWSWKADQVNGPDDDQTGGLAYVWGSKNPGKAMKHVPVPPAVAMGDNGEIVKDNRVYQGRLYGLDCSGYIRECARYAGVELKPENAAGIAGYNSNNTPDLSCWNEKDILKDNKIKMIAVPTDTPPQTGDILYWRKGTGSHIGIVGEIASGRRIVLHSSGSYSYTHEELLKSSGPTSDIYDSNTNASVMDYYGEELYRLRLVAEIEGRWYFHLRCVGQEYDAISFKFDLKEENTSNQIIKITSDKTNGIDYDGSPFSGQLEGTYNKSSNMIEFTITYSFVDQTPRSDKFSGYLDTSMKGYKVLTKIIDNGACTVAGKLEVVTEGKQQTDRSIPALTEKVDCGLGYCEER